MTILTEQEGSLILIYVLWRSSSGCCLILNLYYSNFQSVIRRKVERVTATFIVYEGVTMETAFVAHVFTGESVD